MKKIVGIAFILIFITGAVSQPPVPGETEQENEEETPPTPEDLNDTTQQKTESNSSEELDNTSKQPQERENRDQEENLITEILKSLAELF